MDTFHLRTLVSGDVEVLQDYNLLDSGFPYATGDTTQDFAPTPLQANWSAYERHEQFQMWLLYKSNRAGSHWVGIRKIDWYCDFYVVNSTPGAFGWDWASPTSKDARVTANAAVYDLPEWQRNVTEVTWQPYG
ncbi:MAG: hypothetical protein KDA47_08645 [Planctomycetales bacterium]|nr:hypothetical protein [Planctomycetales bacterium]